MSHDNEKLEEEEYDIPDIDARLAAMKCQHIYTHSVECDKCHYIPYEEDTCGALHYNQPVDNTTNVYSDSMLVGAHFDEFIKHMRLQNVTDKIAAKQVTPSRIRRDKILAELKERHAKGKLSDKKYTQMVIATHMQDYNFD